MLQSHDRTDSVFRQLDWLTIGLYGLLVIVGVFSIYAAGYDFDDASMFSFDEFSGKQVVWIGLALILGMILLLIRPRMYETYAYPIYVGFLILLLITPFIARDIKGSRSWLSFGAMSLQPAEFAKFATGLALAKLFSTYNFLLNAKPTNFLRALAIIFLPVLLILNQNETGSALVYLSLAIVLYREGMSGLVLLAGIFGVTIFVVGIKYVDPTIASLTEGELAVFVLVMIISVVMARVYGKKGHIARNLLLFFAAALLALYILASLCKLSINGRAFLIAVIGVGGGYLIFESIKRRISKLLIPVISAALAIIFLFSVNFAFTRLQPHQQQRIKVALAIEDDPKGAGYNVNQSKIAIGSGGFAGKGFLNGTQTKLKYVPEQHTDFIFCTIGEEEGFVGSAAVIILYVALILRIITLAERQPRPFGRVYGYCVASYLIFHFCINIGMVIGLCPVIGIPLPFISYGGSSLWGFSILLFVLLRLDAARKSSL